MKKIEHVGIAVKDIDAAEKVFESLFNKKAYKRERVESEGVTTSFFKIGPNKFELLEANDDKSPIARYLIKHREGIHHIAFEVQDIKAEMSRLEENGFVLLSEEPKKGADNKLICFLHPKSSNGVLIELCQEIK